MRCMVRGGGHEEVSVRILIFSCVLIFVTKPDGNRYVFFGTTGIRGEKERGEGGGEIEIGWGGWWRWCGEGECLN